MSDKKNALTPPIESTGSEIARASLRALAGAVPMAGSALSEALSLIVNAPLQKRVHAWREEVMRRIQALEEGGFDVSSLKDNEDFASVVMDAQIAVMRSNAAEKREALTNAVLNVALKRAPEEDRLQMFMNYISDLTPWHLRLLALLNDPTGVSQKSGVNMTNISVGAVADLIERVFPELAGKRDFYEQLGNDLTNRGLLGGTGFHTTMTASGIMSKRTTKAGEEFIRFITAP
jgi:hypothetical protein